ncbi:MAG: class I SAM-dependent methyltransferase [Bacteroidetes bacterium]|nr:class I SAM-dependent methyltransferase [Bacteroidota bacterium]
MSLLHENMNEISVASAFTRQSAIFDAIYSEDKIIQYKRERVRNHVSGLLSPNCNILELNCGTGEDAVFFAKLGHIVHATDSSEGMQELLKEKIKKNHLEERVSCELCSYTNLEQLERKGPYDLIFSNFAGLNCTNELDKVLTSFDALLKPRGTVVLVLLPKFCLWETLLIAKGKFKTATRRWFGTRGRKAHIEGVFFKCWYFNPSYIKKRIKNKYEIQNIEGLCTIVPPSYIEHFGEKYPRLFEFLKKKETILKNKFPWRSIGDYYIISFRKK